MIGNRTQEVLVHLWKEINCDLEVSWYIRIWIRKLSRFNSLKYLKSITIKHFDQLYILIFFCVLFFVLSYDCNKLLVIKINWTDIISYLKKNDKIMLIDIFYCFQTQQVFDIVSLVSDHYCFETPKTPLSIVYNNYQKKES